MKNNKFTSTSTLIDCTRHTNPIASNKETFIKSLMLNIMFILFNLSIKSTQQCTVHGFFLYFNLTIIIFLYIKFT